MTLKQWISLIALLLCFSNVASAHSRTHPVLIREIVMMRKLGFAVYSLADQGKIDDSWKQVSEVTKQELTLYKNTPVWRFMLDNPHLQNSEKKTIYVFITLHGVLLGAAYHQEPSSASLMHKN